MVIVVVSLPMNQLTYVQFRGTATRIKVEFKTIIKTQSFGCLWWSKARVTIYLVVNVQLL